MTTERREARVRTSPLELRLYLAALLAVVYTITWRAISGHAVGTSSVVPTTTETTATLEPPRIVWIDTLPPEMRPAVTLPAGWQRAVEARPSTPLERIVRVPSRRVPRVRTRSS